MKSFLKQITKSPSNSKIIKNLLKYIEIIGLTYGTFMEKIKIKKIGLNTFINKKKAIHKIIRKLVPKRNKKNIFNKHNNTINNKPILIFFGKGNGSITILNLKNSGPKGPIKTIAKELAKYCLVILTDEFRTSKICSSCKEKEVIHPKFSHTKKKTYRDENKKRIKETVIIEKRSHKLCYCQNNNYSEDKLKTAFNEPNIHKVWNRDYNAGRNIMFVGITKLTKGKLGIFSRRRKLKTDKEISIRCSLEHRRAKKSSSQKVSLVDLTKTKTFI